jgi:rhomboid protease GluP
MDLDRICLWFTAGTCAFLLVRFAQHRFAGRRGWAGICVAILMIDGVGYLIAPDYVGRIGAACWVAFLALPSLLSQLSARRVLQRRFAAARRYATLTWLLHPFDGQSIAPTVIDALDLAHRGRTDEAIALLSRMQDDPRLAPAMKPVIAAHRARIAQDWAAILSLGSSAGAANPVPPSMRLRALGETGHLGELVREFRTIPPSANTEYQLCLLFLYAFCGRRDALAAVLYGPMVHVDDDSKTFWLATADLADGREAGLTALAILASRDGPARDAARERLGRGVAVAAAVLGPAERQVIAETEAGMHRDADYRELAHGQWLRSYVVLGLAALNLAVFLLEVRDGGSESARVLYRLGALEAETIVKGGEWWRLLTALFLHAGPVHLGANLLALLVIGPWVEWMVGRWRMLLVYFGCGLGSMAIVLALILSGLMADELVVGASGAILGVVGAEVALLARGWRRLGSRLAARRLMAMGVLVGVQVVFDLTTPQVSFAAHASGFVIGVCLMALLMVVGWVEPKAKPMVRDAPSGRSSP